MWKRFSEIEVSSWSRLMKYIITISVHIYMWKHHTALRSSWSRLLNYITTISCHNDESAAVVVADDVSSSSLLLLLSGAGTLLQCEHPLSGSPPSGTEYVVTSCHARLDAFVVQHVPFLLRTPDLPAFSTPATWCRVVHSCVFSAPLPTVTSGIWEYM